MAVNIIWEINHLLQAVAVLYWEFRMGSYECIWNLEVSYPADRKYPNELWTQLLEILIEKHMYQIKKKKKKTLYKSLCKRKCPFDKISFKVQYHINTALFSN